jgi:hypothetical protein
MLHFPLLSDAYAAALFGADETQRRDGGAEVAPCSLPSAASEEDDERKPLPPPEEEDDDLETAPTRPLRLDQIHL